MIKRTLLALLFCNLLASSLVAAEVSPWISPPWECQGGLGYGFEHFEHVQSPAGSFRTVQNTHHFRGSFGMTVWPRVNVEGELVLAKNSLFNFAFEALYLSGRYVLCDDQRGDFATVTAGTSLTFAGGQVLRNLSFAYHGYANVEFNVALGKEFGGTCCQQWQWRLWSYFGYGIAERGSPWIRSIISLDQELTSCIDASLFVQMLYGLGHNNIIAAQPFPGYASIGHQAVDLGLNFSYGLGPIGSFDLLGWINLHARDFPQHALGFSAQLRIPFSL